MHLHDSVSAFAGMKGLMTNKWTRVAAIAHIWEGFKGTSDLDQQAHEEYGAGNRARRFAICAAWRNNKGRNVPRFVCIYHTRHFISIESNVEWGLHLLDITMDCRRRNGFNGIGSSILHTDSRISGNMLN